MKRALILAGILMLIPTKAMAAAIDETRKGKYTGYVKKVLTISEALERAHNK